MLKGYLLCLIPTVSSTRWRMRGLIPTILKQVQKLKTAKNQSCNVSDPQRSELCHPPSSGALACELSTVVFACQAPDESLWGKSFLWCRHVTSFKANESYVHALRAEYFMPWRSRLRKKNSAKNHTALNFRVAPLWSLKRSEAVRHASKCKCQALPPPKHVHLSLCEPTILQGI